MEIKDTITDGPAALGDRPSRHGKLLGAALATIAAIGRRDAPMPIPDCCLTCAFREGSAPNMTAGTGKLALDCVLGIDQDRFACHHGMKDGQPQKICTGYVAALLAPFPEVRAILCAFYDELKEIDDSAPDEIRTAFDAWLAVADPEQRMDVYEAARAFAKHVLAEKQAAGRLSLSDRLTPLLISAGLVRGTTPRSIRKQLGARIPDSALWPLDGSGAEQPRAACSSSSASSANG